MYFLKYIKLSSRSIRHIGLYVCMFPTACLCCQYTLFSLFIQSVYIGRCIGLWQVHLFIVQTFLWTRLNFFCSIKHLPRRQTCEQQNVGIR